MSTSEARTSDEQFLRRLIQLAAEMGDFYDPEGVPGWFFESQKVLNDRRPIDMIEGDIAWADLCARMAALRDGAFV